MTMPCVRSRRVLVLATLFLTASGLAAPWRAADGGAPPAAEAGPAPASEADAPSEPGTVEAYLSTVGLDAKVREGLASGGPWSDAMQAVALRLLTRLETAPRSSMARWRSAAVGPAPPAAAADGNPPEKIRAAPTLVRIEGRAVGLERVPLSAADATLQDRRHYDVVRIRSDDGAWVDVITAAAPAAWRTLDPLDERTEVVGLSVGPGPVWKRTSTPDAPNAPPGATDARPPAATLMVAASIAWFPTTLLGSLGMDYALFDGVIDGRGLEASEADAFYAVLAAAGRARPGAVAAAADAAPPDIVSLIDPAKKWIDSHRGEPVAVSGVARRATRIAVDSPERRRQIGADHYWELFVFTDTPLLEIDGRVQSSYPVVCCVRSLPEGMPRGEQMTEHVDVAGFAFKRYRYRGAEESLERESPLLIGGRPTWRPPARADAETGTLGWILGGLAALTAVLVGGFAWRMSHDALRADRDHARGLPDRFEPPPES